MADFNWYLSKQGLRGLTGEKGDQGFSPIIDVVEDTLESYKLRITTENDEIETPNLKGTLSIDDMGGTYVRYDRETGELVADEADRASKEDYGVVRLAKVEDLDNLELQDTVAITPETLREGLGVNLVSPDNSIQIVLNPDTQKTELKAITGGIEGDIAQERAERIAEDSSIRQSISTLSTSLQTTNSRVTNITSDLATEKQVRLAADTQQQSQIDAERQEREIQDASLQNQLNTKLTVDNIKAGDNVTITKDGNNVTINSTGGGGGSGDVTAAGNNVFTGINTFTNTIAIGDRFNHTHDYIYYDNNTEQSSHPEIYGPFAGLALDTLGHFYERRWLGDGLIVSPVLAQADVDNQTIKVVDGVLHADFSEIGDEVNTLAGRMNIVENELGDLTERVDDLALFKFPNATIIGEPTINNGQISNFNSSNYLQFPFEFETKGRTWLLNGSFHTGSDVTTQQNIIDSLASVALAVRSGRLVMALSTNGTTFNLGEHISMSDIEANTTYYFRISFSGIAYTLSLSTDKIDYMPEAIVESSDPIASKPMTISSSGHPYSDTINLNDWDLTVANTLVWQGMDDVGIASRMDVNATNVTETGKENIKNIAGVGQIDEALSLLNGEDSTLLSTKADVSFSNINDDAKQVIRDVAGGGTGGGTVRSVNDILPDASGNVKVPVDGEWVVKAWEVANKITVSANYGGATFDIEDYIPLDTGIYEVLTTFEVEPDRTAVDNVVNLSVSTDYMPNLIRGGYMRTQVQNRYAYQYSNGTLLFGSGRKLYVSPITSASAKGTYTIRFNAYRRVR